MKCEKNEVLTGNACLVNPQLLQRSGILSQPSHRPLLLNLYSFLFIWTVNEKEWKFIRDIAVSLEIGERQVKWKEKEIAVTS